MLKKDTLKAIGIAVSAALDSSETDPETSITEAIEDADKEAFLLEIQIKNHSVYELNIYSLVGKIIQNISTLGIQLHHKHPEKDTEEISNSVVQSLLQRLPEEHPLRDAAEIMDLQENIRHYCEALLTWDIVPINKFVTAPKSRRKNAPLILPDEEAEPAESDLNQSDDIDLYEPDEIDKEPEIRLHIPDDECA